MILESGSDERLKLVAHGTLGALAAGCLIYNAAAFLYRRERHLAVNVALYSLITLLEIRQVRHHWTASTSNGPSSSSPASSS